MNDQNNSHRKRRLTSTIIIASVLSLAGLAAAYDGAGSESAEAATRAASVDVAADERDDTSKAALALGYQPGGAAGEQRIAAAQKRASELPSAEAYADLALALLQRKRETSDAAYLHYAVDALEAAKAVDADAFRVRLVETLVAQDGHRFKEALKSARVLSQLRPDNSVGPLLAGDALLELGRYDDAIEAYQKAVDVRPDLRSYNRAAYLRWLHGDFEGALDTIELALDSGSPRDPESMAWCYVDLGTMYLERGDAGRAIASANRAELLVKDYAPSLMLRGHALAMKGDRDDAIAVLGQAVERLPHVRDLLFLSELQQQAGNVAQAQRRREQAEKLGGGDPRPLAAYYARHGIQLQRAVELSERELEQRKNILAYDTHALVMLRVGKLDVARASLEKAMKLGTLDADLFLHRALLELAEGNRDEARTAFDRALEINPAADLLIVVEIRTALEGR
jgi:tetratricopeptide (TPR) repeat protein